MSHTKSLPYTASLQEYEREARMLWDTLGAGDDAAAWRFKWEHPRFRGKLVSDVRAAPLSFEDAELVIAQEYAFDRWEDLARFTEAVKRAGPVQRFEAAADAIVAGDVATLQLKLRDDPELVRARSARRHHATLLHYIAANGVESVRQQTPPNAVEVAKLLLDHGAEVDALADMYDNACTTMSMLVSSSHPAEAGLQAPLAETLIDYGAALVGPGSKWQSAVSTALAFGFLATAERLVERGAPVDDVALAAGLGRLADATRLLPSSDPASRHIALALAAQHGHADVVRLLLDAGEDPNRYNPDGFHSHSTPLHQAVWSSHSGVVRLLVERGARLDIQDTIYQGTPLDWAIYGRRTEIAEYLRERSAPPT